jgi:hypothetical protein
MSASRTISSTVPLTLSVAEQGDDPERLSQLLKESAGPIRAEDLETVGAEHEAPTDRGQLGTFDLRACRSIHLDSLVLLAI